LFSVEAMKEVVTSTAVDSMSGNACPEASAGRGAHGYREVARPH
jgi:hypothetical protein